jgi:hypothetical protein
MEQSRDLTEVIPELRVTRHVKEPGYTVAQYVMHRERYPKSTTALATSVQMAFLKSGSGGRQVLLK